MCTPLGAQAPQQSPPKPNSPPEQLAHRKTSQAGRRQQAVGNLLCTGAAHVGNDRVEPAARAKRDTRNAFSRFISGPSSDSCFGRSQGSNRTGRPALLGGLSRQAAPAGKPDPPALPVTLKRTCPQSGVPPAAQSARGRSPAGPAVQQYRMQGKASVTIGAERSSGIPSAAGGRVVELCGRWSAEWWQAAAHVA